MADNTITNAIDFLTRIRQNDISTVKFTKQNGEERIMRCTLNMDRVPASQRPKDVNFARMMKLVQQNKIIHVYDLDKQDWRSLPFDRSEWLETGGTKYKISK